MKKIILVLFLMSSVLSAETVYVMSRKDYYDLCAKISAIETDRASGITMPLKVLADLRHIRNSLTPMEKSTFSSDIDWDIVKKVLREYDNQRYYSGANSRLDRELTTDEKLSILGGRIDLLEKQLKGFMKVK